MKRLLCYGDSNSFGTAPMTSMDDIRRFDHNTRWPGVMAATLGKDWTVVEECLSGRTTVHDDPIEGIYKNGRTYLAPCLESHWPLDLITIMLGTNDLKPRFSLGPMDIALGAGLVLFTIKSLVPAWTKPPKLLLICPPPVFGAGCLTEIFEGSEKKAKALPPLYKAQAERFGASFFDAAPAVKISPIDGVHFDEANHKALGLAVAAEVKRLCP